MGVDEDREMQSFESVGMVGLFGSLFCFVAIVPVALFGLFAPKCRTI